MTINRMEWAFNRRLEEEIDKETAFDKVSEIKNKITLLVSKYDLPTELAKAYAKYAIDDVIGKIWNNPEALAEINEELNNFHIMLAGLELETFSKVNNVLGWTLTENVASNDEYFGDDDIDLQKSA